MKPRTKLQFRVLNLSLRCLCNRENQMLAWAKESCLEHKGFATKTRVVCMDCGQRFSTDLVKRKRAVCPHCQTKLKITNTRRITDKQSLYLAYAEIYEEFQLIRFFELNVDYKASNPAYYFIHEIMQQWILPNGKHEFYSRRRKVSYYGNSWQGNIEIREKNAPRYQYWKANLYNIGSDFIYPKVDLLPEFKKRGITNKFHGITPLDLFLKVLENNKLETLLKIKQYKLLAYSIYKREAPINQYWQSVRICARNKYKIKDVGIWVDYLDLLSYFGKDLCNAKYVCPANLKEEHDRLVIKKRRKQEREKLESLKAEIAKDDITYQKEKARFFGLHFTDGNIDIQPLSSVREFVVEGDTLHHCVFTNNYHKEKDSLVLSAKVNGRRTETIEFSLETMKVVQSRGLQNESSEYHDSILKLMKENIKHIKRVATAKKKAKKSRLNGERKQRVAV